MDPSRDPLAAVVFTTMSRICSRDPGSRSFEFAADRMKRSRCASRS